MSGRPIADYALLSDRHGAALVSRDGSVDWLCVPRFDSGSIFARLLDDQAGSWSLRAPDATAVTRRYVDRTMVLETTYRTPTGTAVVVDALATGFGNRGHALGRGSPHLLLRQVTCSDGEVEMHVEYVPRPEYGLVVPLLDAVEGGLVATGGADVLVLSCPLPLEVGSSSASGTVVLRAGERAGFALHHTRRADATRGPDLEPGRDRDAARRHRVGVAVVVGAAPGVRRPMARARPPQRPRAPGVVVPAHRRDLRGGHHVVARGGGRLPQLGLPLRVGPGCVVHHRGAVGGGVPRRGRRVRRVHDDRRGRIARSRTATCRSCSASAANAT